MKLYWTELRRSPLRWWFPLLLVLDLVALFGRNLWWIGEWPQTSAQAQIPAFYFASLLAAAAAWAAGRTSRNNLDEQLAVAARPGWQIELAQLSATLTYGLVVYGVGVAVAASVSLPTAGPGFLWPTYIFLGVALLVIFASAGHLVGRRSRSQFAGPVLCGLGSLVIISWFGAPTALGLFAISAAPFEQVSLLVLVDHCVLAFLLTVAACLVTRPPSSSVGHTWAGKRRRQLRVISLGALVVSVIAGMVTAGPLQVPRSSPRQPACTSGGSPKVCVWPEDHKYLPQAQEMQDRMRRLPAGMFTIPTVFYERGLRGMRDSYDDFYIMDGSMWDPSVTIAGSIMAASRPKGCPLPIGPRITDQFKQAEAELNVWLAMRIFGGGVPAGMHGGPPNVDLNAVARVVTQPEGAQVEWAQQRIETIHHAFCG